MWQKVFAVKQERGKKKKPEDSGFLRILFRQNKQ